MEILKDEFKILTGRTFSRNIMAWKLSVFSSLMSNYSFHDNFCQKIIIYLESLYNKLYFDIKFIWKYWNMNSKSWQDGLFHGTKRRENYQCSRLWCQIILFRTDRRTDERTNERAEMDRPTDGWTDRRTDERTDGRTDGETNDIQTSWNLGISA